MQSSAGTHSRHLTEGRAVTRGAGSFVTRKVWLPKALYVALPYFYLLAGSAAFLATLYISNWLWVDGLSALKWYYQPFWRSS